MPRSETDHYMSNSSMLSGVMTLKGEPHSEAGGIAFTDAACPRLRRGRYPSWTGALSVVDGGAIRLARGRYPSWTLQLYAFFLVNGGYENRKQAPISWRVLPALFIVVWNRDYLTVTLAAWPLTRTM